MVCLETYREYAKFYEFPPGAEVLEITHELLNSPLVRDREKNLILDSNRKVFVFTYPSDGLKIKGVISFTPKPEKNPVTVFLRGGNRMFGILNPGSDYIVHRQTTTISTLYRGGASEGTDEFGGDDVNDVKHLMDHLPVLERQLGITISSQMFLLGASRGGMQMCLALARFPELQSKFLKVASLSGLLDMRERIGGRSDMEKMFIDDFGLKRGPGEEVWIDRRDPILAVEKIHPSLPMLVIQGTKDERTHLQIGYNLVNKRKGLGGDITYWEIEGGSHCLTNDLSRMDKINDWFLDGISTHH